MRFYTQFALILSLLCTLAASCVKDAGADGREDARIIIDAMQRNDDVSYDLNYKRIEEEFRKLEGDRPKREEYKKGFSDELDKVKGLEAAYSTRRFPRPSGAVDEGHDVVRKNLQADSNE